jgi:DNA-binding beta-propeller fold protein YncE
MTRNLFVAAVLSAAAFASSTCAWAGQAPAAASAPEIPVSHHDRVYAAEQFSNTVSVTDPVDNKLLGVIRLGDPGFHIALRRLTKLYQKSACVGFQDRSVPCY